MSQIHRIRVTGDVLDTANAIRRHTLDGEVLTFGREPVYLEADELPENLANDNYLRIDTVEAAPAGVRVIQKKKRLPLPDDNGTNGVDKLKAERVQEESVAQPGDIADLKAERVQEPANAAHNDNDDTNKLKAERVQEPASAAKKRH